jgi:hypothetical protein
MERGLVVVLIERQPGECALCREQLLGEELLSLACNVGRDNALHRLLGSLVAFPPDGRDALGEAARSRSAVVL